VAQVVEHLHSKHTQGPEFNFQYHQKKKREKEKENTTDQYQNEETSLQILQTL
jgi:hypothetical protein